MNDTIKLALNLNRKEYTGEDKLVVYAFSAGGKYLAQAPANTDALDLALDGRYDGRDITLAIAPTPEGTNPTTAPSLATLKKLGAHLTHARALRDIKGIDIVIPPIIFPKICFCTVRGKLVKRFTLPDGTQVQRPVCNARVHICEIDSIPLIIDRIPDLDINRLRESLLDKLRVIPRPFPPGPDPDPIIRLDTPLALQARTLAKPLAATQPLAPDLSQAVIALSANQTPSVLRRTLIDLRALISIHLCEFKFLWKYFKKTCHTTLYVDGDGQFNGVITHRCTDQPDIYIWVEQYYEGAWHTVYNPSIPCGTYWDYKCGTEITLNLPKAHACDRPTIDLPDGVVNFVLPYKIGETTIWGKPGTPAPFGWVRSDGLVDYASSPLGNLYNAPFGGILNFYHDDSYFIPSTAIKYYRYSFRRFSATPNSGPTDPSWTPITTALARGYRMEYSDRLPTYESYPVGPFSVGSHSNLFKFKPQTPPARSTDPATVVVREWLSGNLNDVAASWNTLIPAPGLSADNTSDDAGLFQIKIEVFDANGNFVAPTPGVFEFLGLEASRTTTRHSTGAEVIAGAYILDVHVDNNGCFSSLPQPSVNGHAAGVECGFLHYGPNENVHLEFTATHPNNRAVFKFDVIRGSVAVPAASAGLTETAAGSAGAYTKIAGNYAHDFAAADLVGTCPLGNAAFSAQLEVYGKATNGVYRIGYDSSRWIAFALAASPTPTP
ncbi:MAG TPA: hypothetical protein PKD17_01845 [Cellvibrionaceae bacterium]|nr:hypothetical protein [Cellvibrionaceae bacterium]HMW70529.1 hypothetical protein [Cellvibrionaceae bacterium]HMY37956.1 hypothetical protein [Marinagarivorans sp.]